MPVKGGLIGTQPGQAQHKIVPRLCNQEGRRDAEAGVNKNGEGAGLVRDERRDRLGMSAMQGHGRRQRTQRARERSEGVRVHYINGSAGIDECFEILARKRKTGRQENVVAFRGQSFQGRDR